MTASIKDRILLMLELEQLTDCEFVFPAEEDPEKSLIKAHKLILAFASPVFNAMFFTFDFGYSETRDNIVEIEDCSPENFAIFLKYAYLHEVQLTSFDEACDVFRIAHKYEVPSLEKLCEEYIIECMSPDDACSAVSFAELHGNEGIKKKAKELICKKTDKVLESQDFLQAHVTVVEFITRCEELNVDEVVLMQAVERYAATNKMTRKEPGMDEVIMGIRFLTMDAKEFNEKCMKSQLLTYIEKLVILNHLLSEDQPSTFSYCVGLSNNKIKRKKNAEGEQPQQQRGNRNWR